MLFPTTSIGVFATRLRVWSALWVAALSFSFIGCAAPGDVELLEAELRRQEDAVRHYRSQLAATRRELETTRRQVDELHRRLADVQEGTPRLLPEHIEALARAEALSVDTWRTGLIPRSSSEHEPVDLHMVLYPRDDGGEIVKLFGELEVQALDLSLPEPERQLGRWYFSTEQTRRMWESGFLTTGIHVRVPLPRIPDGQELLLHAALTLVDGRTLSVTHPLTVRRQRLSGRPEASPRPATFFPPADSRPVELREAEADGTPAASSSNLFSQIPSPPEEGEFLQAFPQQNEGLDANPWAKETPPTNTSDNWTLETLPLWR